jgi:hypothetical protein
MTEAEGLAGTDPEPMLIFLRGKASDRKVRLFGVACSRPVWHPMEDERRRPEQAPRAGVDGATLRHRSPGHPINGKPYR